MLLGLLDLYSIPLCLFHMLSAIHVTRVLFLEKDSLHIEWEFNLPLTYFRFVYTAQFTTASGPRGCGDPFYYDQSH